PWGAAAFLRKRVPDRKPARPLAALPRHQLRLLVGLRDPGDAADVRPRPRILRLRAPHRPPSLFPLRPLRLRALPVGTPRSIPSSSSPGGRRLLPEPRPPAPRQLPGRAGLSGQPLLREHLPGPPLPPRPHGREAE